MNEVSIEIVRDATCLDLPLPKYATVGSSGADLFAAVEDEIILKPMRRALIPTGIRVSCPVGYEIQIRPRSGLANKNGVTVLNTPGTIDSDYRGPLGVILINLGDAPFVVRRGDRIAQMVVQIVPKVLFVEVSDLTGTSRGSGGFGSTGV